MASPDDELFSILLTNLRNAAATFGEGTPPYESIRTTIEEHLVAMKSRASKTNLSGLSIDGESSASAASMSMSFANLALRPKPRS